MILTDDLGYADLSCYGAGNIKTPNLDRMAAEGLRLTDFHTPAGVCTPTRAALMTGCYPKRVGLHVAVLSNTDSKGLNPSEITLAELLRAQGYATGIIGKWPLRPSRAPIPRRQRQHLGGRSHHPVHRPLAGARPRRPSQRWAAGHDGFLSDAGPPGWRQGP